MRLAASQTSQEGYMFLKTAAAIFCGLATLLHCAEEPQYFFYSCALEARSNTLAAFVQPQRCTWQHAALGSTSMCMLHIGISSTRSYKIIILYSIAQGH